MTKKLFYNGDILTLEDELYAEAVLVEDGTEHSFLEWVLLSYA